MDYDVRRYLTVRSAYGADWGPEGEELAVLHDASGVTQAWTLEGPRAWPEQWTTGEERVTFVDWSPTRRELVFGRDRGGNERAQLHLLDVDDGSIDDLTRAPDAKHRWGGWSQDGDRIAFASNRREESVFDLYVQRREERGEDAALVAEGDGWLSLAGWSPGDDRLLVHEARSSFDHDLHVLHLDDGRLEQVTHRGGDVRYSSPEWGPAGDAIYLATDAGEIDAGETDAGADVRSLARLDPESGELTTVRESADWNVTGVEVDEESSRIAYTRNVDGFTELTVGRLSAGADVEPGLADASDVSLPGGVAGGVDFDSAGDRLALTVTGRRHNANVWVAELEGSDSGDGALDVGELEQWTAAPTAGIPADAFREPELVRYPSTGADGARTSLDPDATDAPETTSDDARRRTERPDELEIPALFTLPEDAEPGETPVIVDVHGGPESQRRPSFRASTQFFLAQGYAVFEPNVRGSTGYGRTYTHLDDVERRVDAVADLRAAHEWLADRDAVDPDRIALKGGSYGGFMTLAGLARYPDLWAAGIDVVGIANFVTFLENTGSWRRQLREAEYGSLEDDRELLEAISPISHVDRIDAPLFVAHGANDPRVPVEEAEQIAAAVEERGLPVELLVFDDEGHGFGTMENRIEASRKYAEFLAEHV